MKPLRQRKHDRLTFGGRTTKEELAIDHAVAPFDAMARSMDQSWGVDRLPSLVSPETAAKYGRTLASLNEAIDSNDTARVVDRVSACCRGMQALEVEALRLGHRKPKSGVMLYSAGGPAWGIVPDAALWPMASDEFPEVRIYTMAEIDVLIRAAEDGHPALRAVKEAFPGAAVVAVREKRTKLVDDDIPF